MAIFLFAGIIKGFLGIGLPAAAMAFLTLVMDPTIAISLLTLPIIFTNIMQYTRCENPRPCQKILDICPRHCAEHLYHIIFHFVLSKSAADNIYRSGDDCLFTDANVWHKISDW